MAHSAAGSEAHDGDENPPPHAHSREQDAAHWRSVAEERDQALAEHEQVNAQLKLECAALSGRLEQTTRELNAVAGPGGRRRLSREAELEEARRLIAAMRATLAWRIAERLRVIFPANTRRGRLIRRIVLGMCYPFRRVSR